MVFIIAIVMAASYIWPTLQNKVFYDREAELRKKIEEEERAKMADVVAAYDAAYCHLLEENRVLWEIVKELESA